MHEVCEIVIPPTSDVEKSIKEIMEYFCEEDWNGKKGNAEWWDFYVIGGRYSGHKLEATLDAAQREKFYAAMKERKVTVSGFQCGKQELSPASQIPMVDELWREMFPGKGENCILFAHSADQYGKRGIYERDICTVAEIPEGLTCARLIVAKTHWKDPRMIQPARMLAKSYWNGVEHQDTGFDGKVKSAIAAMRADHKAIDAQPDWLVVMVDYHN